MTRLFAAFVFALAAAAGAVTDLQLRWGELPAAVAGKRADIRTCAGATLRGRILAVDARGMEFQAGWSSDTRAWPVGRILIPPREVCYVALPAPPGKALRSVAAGIGVGAAGAVVVGFFLATQVRQSGGEPSRQQRNTAIGLGAASAGAGVLIGVGHGRKAVRNARVCIAVVP